MKNEQFIEILKGTNRGEFHSITLSREIPFMQKHGGHAVKTSIVRGQIGVPYANTKAIREAVESGERGACHLPDWAEHYPVVNDKGQTINLWRHKKRGELFFPVIPNAHTPHKPSVWSVDGKEVAHSDIAHKLYARDRKTGERKPFTICKVENIKSFS